MLDQRQRRWADIEWMLYKYFVFTGNVNIRNMHDNPCFKLSLAEGKFIAYGATKESSSQ